MFAAEVIVRRIQALFLVLTVVGCGGGGGDDGDGGGGGADAGPDALPPVTMPTAMGALPGAQQIAVATHPDAVLYRVVGQYVNGTTGEVDPALVQPSWQYSFVSASAGKLYPVLWSHGTYTPPQNDGVTFDPTGKRMIVTDWLDSDDALATMVRDGYMPPPQGDPDWSVGMTLQMFLGSPMDFRSGIAEPIWNVDIVHAPPGQTPMGEQWVTTFWSAMNKYVVCKPNAMMCDLLDPP